MVKEIPREIDIISGLYLLNIFFSGIVLLWGIYPFFVGLFSLDTSEGFGALVAVMSITLIFLGALLLWGNISARRKLIKEDGSKKFLMPIIDIIATLFLISSAIVILTIFGLIVFFSNIIILYYLIFNRKLKEILK